MRTSIERAVSQNMMHCIKTINSVIPRIRRKDTRTDRRDLDSRGNGDARG